MRSSNEVTDAVRLRSEVRSVIVERSLSVMASGSAFAVVSGAANFMTCVSSSTYQHTIEDPRSAKTAPIWAAYLPLPDAQSAVSQLLRQNIGILQAELDTRQAGRLDLLVPALCGVQPRDHVRVERGQLGQKGRGGALRRVTAWISLQSSTRYATLGHSLPLPAA